MKRFVIGDTHGGHRAMLQVFDKSKVDYKKDKLICLGDVSDGWSQAPECFDELLKFKNLVYVIGNHDLWLREYFKTGATPRIWTSQGGLATINAYERIGYPSKTSRRHQKLLEKALPYYTEDNKLFVHGGFNRHYPINEQDEYDLAWDRDLYTIASYWENRQKDKNLKIKEFDEVFVGHTTTSIIQPDLTPVHVSNLWNLDQGAGWEGKLTLMNVDTKEYFQSDLVKTLYPEEKGR